MTTIPEYPRNLPLLSVEVTERMKWSGTIQTHASGSEGRLSYWSEPLWEFDLQYNGLRDGFWGDRAYDELSQIQGLFGVSAGSTQGFKYLHPKWNSVSHQRIGFLSGGLTTYDLVRSYGPFSDASLQAVEHIGVLSDEVPFNLYVSNSSVPLLPTDPSYGYTLDTSKPGQQQLIFNSVPPSGHTIFADMGYFFYCRFAQGPFEYQKFAKNLYGAQKVSLVSCRAESQQMRAASSGLIAFLKSRQPCYKADLFTITLADGSVDLRTSFDSDLTYGASTWLARGPLISRSGISVRNTPEIPEMTVTLKAPPSYQYFGAPIRQQVVNGIFDGASFQLNRTFMPTPGDTSLGIPVMFLGKKSGIKQVGDLITITVKGGNVTLNQFAPKNVYQTACSHTFCDAGCTLNAASFTISKAVGSSPQPLLIPWNSAPGDPGDYTLGKIKMTSGASAGQTRQIKFADSSGIVPAYPFDDGVSAGDTFTAMQGCDKTVTRCTALSNLQHYRGFPFIPSASSAIQGCNETDLRTFQ